MAPRADGIVKRLRCAVVLAAQTEPPWKVSKQFGVSRKFVRYWSQRVDDPTFHAGTRGGARNLRFTPHTEQLILVALWQELRADPNRTMTAFACELVRSNNNPLSE